MRLALQKGFFRGPEVRFFRKTRHAQLVNRFKRDPRACDFHVFQLKQQRIEHLAVLIHYFHLENITKPAVFIRQNFGWPHLVLCCPEKRRGHALKGLVSAEVHIYTCAAWVFPRQQETLLSFGRHCVFRDPGKELLKLLFRSR